MATAFGEASYTIDCVTAVEMYVDNLLREIVDAVVTFMSPRSVILYGSLGRGEGTGYVTNGKLHLISDLEIGIVADKWWRRVFLSRLQRNLEDKLGVDITLSFFLHDRFDIGRISNCGTSINPMTLEQYELVSASRLLWGVEPRHGLGQADPANINPWDAPRLLFNRLAEIIEVMVSLPADPSRLDKAVVKSLIACGDATLLLNEHYHYSYVERRQRVATLVNSEKAITCKGILPADIDWTQVLHAYDWKLYPDRYSLDDMTASLAFQALRCTIPWALGKVLGIAPDEVTSVGRDYLSSARLVDCCRIFPGSAMSQSSLILAKQILHGYFGEICLLPWREVHRVYLELLKLANEILENDFDTHGRVQFSPNTHRVASRLIRRWRGICCMV